MADKLPPLPDDVFDGHKESTEVVKTKCNHQNAKITEKGLLCACGASWNGPGLKELEKLLSNNT